MDTHDSRETDQWWGGHLGSPTTHCQRIAEGRRKKVVTSFRRSANNMNGIYLDHNATCPVHPDVLAAMLPFFQRHAGNASSAHIPGAEARAAIDRARSSVASLVGAPSPSVLFTSSATEAINMAIHSALSFCRGSHPRIVLTAVEHAAVRQCVRSLEETGVEAVVVSVDREGALDLEALSDAITPDTCLVSVMWANNETGVIFPIPSIAELCATSQVALHVDGVQAAGKLPISLQDVPIDYLSISAHKLFGPKGAGALVAAPSKVRSLLHGGNQEKGRRAGTENVPAIVGFGEAARLALVELEDRAATVQSLRDRLEIALRSVDGCYINGQGQPRIPNTVNVGFPGIDGDAIAGVLDAAGIYVSTGSACNADTLTPSHVITAMTHSYERASEAVRFSLSHFNTEEEIEQTGAAVRQSVSSLRSAPTHA
jgi:cysteine desulfurase